MSYRVTLSRNTNEILNRDKVLFNINSMNHLYNLIIRNHYETFPINKKRIDDLYNVLENIVPKKKIANTIKSIIELDVKTKRLQRGKDNEKISIKVTRISEKVLRDLEYILEDYEFESINAILREIIISYSSLTTLEKEKIVLQENLEIIEKAMKNKHKLEITYNDQKLIVKPYTLFIPIDDFSHYVLVTDTTNNVGKIIRVAKITKLHENEYERFTISDKAKTLIKQYQSNQITVFDSAKALIFKKSMEDKNLDAVVPYLIDEARKSYDNDNSVLDKTK